MVPIATAAVAFKGVVKPEPVSRFVNGGHAFVVSVGCVELVECVKHEFCVTYFLHQALNLLD